MVNKQNKVNPQNLALGILKVLNTRTQDIFKRRFGLTDGHTETLESIGKSYKVTRERIRQIENAAFNIISKASVKPDGFNEFMNLAESILQKAGGTMFKDRFLDELQNNFEEKIFPSVFTLLLRLDKRFEFIPENDKCREVWTLKGADSKKVFWLLEKLEAELSKQDKPTKIDDLQTLAKKYIPQLTVSQLENYLYISKTIASNPFREYGMNTWQNIEPRGARDKAYLIMRHANSPLHFKEISRMINDGSNYEITNATTPALWQKSIKTQTIHNELIKDGRFVLVGRGIYALSEWGYEPGTVRDVIIRVLEEAKKPLTREEIVKSVRSKRMVKENTVLLNLQDKKTFVRTPDRRYTLAKQAVKSRR